MAERPQPEEIAKWHRWFAVEANNRAWQLTEQEEPTDEQRAETLLAAYASVYHWSQAGTEKHKAMGEMLLARAHVVAREPEAALRYAKSSYDYFTTHESDPWQVAFAHALIADAAALAGDSETHRHHYEIARKAGEGLGEEDRAVFLSTFNRVPAPI